MTRIVLSVIIYIYRAKSGPQQEKATVPCSHRHSRTSPKNPEWIALRPQLPQPFHPVHGLCN